MALPYRQALIVLGMHRSGTSALAGAAVRLGLAGPRVEVPVADDNPAGFYEPHHVVIINHRLLKAAGCAWNLCLHFHPEKLLARLTPADKRDIFKTLHEEFGETTSFVLKDPRLCLTLPAWLPALQINGAALRVFILVRHPAEVMESLRRRQDRPMAESMTHWLHHMLEAERATRDMPRAVLLYDELLADWRTTIARASQAAGMVWPVPNAAGIDAFLQSSARHHNLSGAVLTGYPPVDGWANAAWSAFRHLAAAPEEPAALAVLNGIWPQFAAFRREIMPEGMVIEVPDA